MPSVDPSETSPSEAIESAVRSVPQRLEEARHVALPPAEWLNERTVVTGVGLSGGPARLLGNHRGRFVPVTALDNDLRASTLVLFSQSLSPNAQLADRVQREQTVVMTGVAPEPEHPRGPFLIRLLGRRGRSVPVPSREQHEAMVRFHSPASASYLALRWLALSTPEASWVRFLREVPTAAEAAFERGLALEAPVGEIAFLTSGIRPSDAHGLAFKWAEACYDGPPPVLDALELAHGPLQARADRPTTFVLLETLRAEALFERARTVLERSGHRCIRLKARLPAPLALLEHDAGLNALVWRRWEVEFRRWETQGIERPLYEVGGAP